MTIDFSSMPIGARPLGFTEGLTGHGEPVHWQVLEDPSVPVGRVIAETSRDTADYRFPLCVYDGLVAKDVEVSVRFKAVDGMVDQAAGLIVRTQDHPHLLHHASERARGQYSPVQGRRWSPSADHRAECPGDCWCVADLIPEDRGRRSRGRLRRAASARSAACNLC